MTFQVSIKIGWRTYNISVALLYIDNYKEQFHIISRKRSVIIEGNRPFFRNKGLKHRRVSWKVIDGTIENNNAYTATLGAIVKYMDTYESKV